MICLNRISHDFAKLKSCNHMFCYSCIIDWSKEINTCPVCRLSFDLLNRADKELIKLYFYNDNACIYCKHTEPV